MKRLIIPVCLVTVVAIVLILTLPVQSEDISDDNRSIRMNIGSEYDELDISFLFEKMGVVSFESTFEPIAGGEYIIAPVVDLYVEGEKAGSIEYFDQWTAGLPGDTPEEKRAFFRGALRHLIVDDTPKTLRTYVDLGDPVNQTISMMTASNTVTLATAFDTTESGGMGTMDFAYSGLKRDEAIPYLSIYAVDKGEPYVPCPFGLPVDDVVQKYHTVWIISLEARSL